jgi:mRNA-degrading endonuclease RelE of RelBE toxin-antitoxin system
LPDYLDDDAYKELQQALMQNPEAGAVMPGTGGFRKLRWSDSRRSKGKRGGLRVIYYWLGNQGQIWMFAIYDKDEATDLSPDEKRLLKAAIEAELSARGEK